MQKTNLEIYKRLLIYVKPHQKFFFISILGFLIYSVTQPLFAQMIQEIIDTLQAKSHEKLYYLPLLFSGLIIVRLAKKRRQRRESAVRRRKMQRKER